MNCEILNTLYLKSNGEILCNDDFGEKIFLGAVEEEVAWDISNIFNGEKYAHIRDSLKNNRVPWDGVCQNCAFIRYNEKYSDLLSKKIITKFQLEPSLACNLACPCCSNYIQVRQRKKPFIMPEELLLSVLNSLKKNRYVVQNFEYCGQGDPLMHPRFKKISQLTREIYPNATQRLITNGNFIYEKVLSDTYIEDIYVSCDGVRQENYSQYRRKGDVSTVLDFIKSIPKTVNNRKQNIVWKYILFEFNDSDEELIEAQEIAQDYGVDTLLFVVTHSEFRSTKYTLETLDKLPILYPNVKTNAHPSFYSNIKQVQKSKINVVTDMFKVKNCLLHIDDIAMISNDLLSMSGWVASKKEFNKVEIFLNDKKIGAFNAGFNRKDVTALMPAFKFSSSFLCTSSIEKTPNNSQNLKFVFYHDDVRISETSQLFTFN